MVFGSVSVTEIGYGLIFLQVFLALWSGRLWQGQRKQLTPYAYTLSQHGGVWVDTLVLTWVLGSVAHTVRFDYSSVFSLTLLAVCTTVWWKMHEGYARAGRIHPEAHAQGGVITLVGMAHFVYIVGATWLVLMFYTNQFAHEPTDTQRALMAIALCLVAVIGVMKVFTGRRWKWTPESRRQAKVALLGVALLHGIQYTFTYFLG